MTESPFLSMLESQDFTWYGVPGSVSHASRKMLTIQKRAKRMIQSLQSLIC